MVATSIGFITLAALIFLGSFLETDEALLRRAQSIFTPLKAPEVLLSPSEDQEIALGRKLFFDTRISKGGGRYPARAVTGLHLLGLTLFLGQ